MLLQNKQVAVIGGGMGGLLLARLLQMKNVSVKVYERDRNDQVRVQGAPLDLHEDSGLKAMKEANLLEEFYQNVRSNASKARIVDQKLELRFDEHEARHSHKDEESGIHGNSIQNISKPRPEIDRSELRSILLNSLEPETIIWDSQFVSMKKENTGWRIYLKNDFDFYADFVVGADGSHSKIRPYLSDIKPVYSGITMLEGTIYNAKENVPQLFEFSKGGKVLAFGSRQAIMYGTKGDGSLMFLASSKLPENQIEQSNLDFTDHQQVYKWFKEVYKDWSPQWDALFTSKELHFILRPQYYFPFNQSWKTQKNLTMLGDAAHRMPPFAGKGANLALLDAVDLAENLTSNQFSDIKTAVAVFEEQMTKRAAAAVKETLENAAHLFSENALERLTAVFKKNNTN
ncbi:FAD-dependent oxidoreductase [Flavobacterium hungaricum]|uniref:Flavin-dependent monooxygenase n=1 Tax=Flavobacterium hungaricum TaxID=2082725 RepID=A0ABR9TG56_9FLAO|nr:FAD-dependent monooxygenase [Flavobacterium hungaricum]MBE8724331.1 FAD-dependent monooxygenase [Flavobacterium hungaricum]